MSEKVIADYGVLLRVEKKDINYINQIMEGYEYLGTVTTLKKGEGILYIRTTPDTYSEVVEIINNLPLNIEILLENTNDKGAEAWYGR